MDKGQIDSLLKRFAVRIAGWTPEINQRGVIKDVVAEGEISPGYLFLLTLANLIALCGLLTNSSPVIIGAMLISPLMGPFLSIGFAFVTGDNAIWNKSVTKIILSVALTILIAGLATYLSPLKELTEEIVSRSRPNLYDLIIAFLAGLAGASALCTKKNYLTVVPGVAIATAVIPPLSVTGFGLGTGDYRVFLGGFLLFFTNLVAIILSTCIVFYFYGFRRSMATEVELSQIKKRLFFLLIILVIISIPLVYTLHQSISEVKLHNAVRNALHKGLDRKTESHLTTFNFRVENDGTLRINAVANVVNYLNETDARKLENRLASELKRKISLNLEQIRVQAEGLKEVPQSPIPVLAPPSASVEKPVSTGDNVEAIVGKARNRLAQIIAPARIDDFYIGMRGYSSASIAVRMRVRSDTPFSSKETAWLAHSLAYDLGHPVEISLETEPFIPLLVFKSGETSLTADMKRKLLIARDICKTDKNINLYVEAFPEHAGAREKKSTRIRLNEVKNFLTVTCGIPEERVRTVIGERRAKGPAIRVKVIPDKAALRPTGR